MKAKVRIAPTKPLAVVSLAVGANAQELAAISWPHFKKYAERVGADFVGLTPPEVKYNFGYKLILGDLLRHWERVLFLDVDIVLEPDCPDLFGLVPADRLGLHDDYPYLKDRTFLEKDYADIIQSQGWDATPEPATCFNTGVIVTSRGQELAFERPKKPAPNGHTAEQSLINLNIVRHSIRVFPLPLELNWQWWMEGFPRGRDGVKVWHYANAPHAERVRLMRQRAGLPALPVKKCGGCGKADKPLRVERLGKQVG